MLSTSGTGILIDISYIILTENEKYSYMEGKQYEIMLIIIPASEFFAADVEKGDATLEMTTLIQIGQMWHLRPFSIIDHRHKC